MEQSDVIKTRDICRHWAKGYCAFGDDCAFPHSGPSPAPAGGGSVVVNGVSADLIPSADELREKDLFAVVKSSVPCKDYQVAKCHRGDKCKFAHIGGPPRRSAACRDWRQGRCNRGDSCRYYHAGGRKEEQQYDGENTSPITYVNAAPPMPVSSAAGPTVVHRIVRYCSTAVAPQSCKQPTVYTAAPQPSYNPTSWYTAPQVTCTTVPAPAEYCVPAPPQPLVHPQPPPLPVTATMPSTQLQSPLCEPAPVPEPAVSSTIAEADAAVAALRRQAEEMEAHAAALRAQANAAAHKVPPVPLPVPAPSTVPSSSVCSRRGSWSPNTEPTTPRRSSGCYSYSGYSSEGGDLDRVPSPPAGPPPPADTDAVATQSHCVMVHDPYAC